jgi:predicted DNA binding CopG/RHH family protein
LLDGTPQTSERRSCSKKELSQRSRLNSTLKTASITIRLTAEEQAQLHERAAAAQLSVSAYLRSCIFEAEALRIQVREALSQLRAATPNDPVEPVQSQAQSARSWRSRLLPLWRSHASARV